MRKTLIIAEAGVNHNGDMHIARQLIDAAVDAGVDLIKFQTFKAEKIVTKTAAKANYQQQNTGDTDGSQFAMLKKLELSYQQHLELIDYCKKKGISFWSTAFDLDSIALLQQMGITLGKVPSGEITNLPYLRAMAKAFETLIISTGMCTLQEVEDAINALTAAGAKRDAITILHCTTEYPAPFTDINLNAMVSMGRYFNLPVGYSDHTEGIEVPVAAVALGACVIEKHFTLDKTMEGPDHKASLEPHELKAMVKAIRNVEKALGDGNKQPAASEIKNIAIARKSVVAATALQAGTVLQPEMLTVKRPGNGISPMQIDELTGKVLKKDLQEDEVLQWEVLQ